MTNVLSRELPAPSNWQDFERLCFDLYSKLWQTNDAEMHGRAGQPQWGVDVYGTDRLENKFVGIQCKGKDSGYGSILTEEEIHDEVEKAKKFEPKLDVFIIATTSANDSKAQTVARKITELHLKTGLFEVRVQAWGTLKQHISSSNDLLQKHFHDFAPYDLSRDLQAATDSIARESESTRQVIREEISRLGARTDESGAPVDALHERIKMIAETVEEGSAYSALKLLERLWENEGTSASPRNRCRIRTNIANVYLHLEKIPEAVTELRAAFEEDRDWPNARAMLATAELLEKNIEKAHEISRSVLSTDPENIQAAQIALDSLPDTTSLEDAITLIPPPLQNKTDLLLSISLFARKIGRAEEAADFARRAYEQSPENWQAISIYAGFLLDPLLNVSGLNVTQKIPSEHAENFSLSLTLLRKAWKILVERDDAIRGIHVSFNLITALELAGLEDEAAKVLDKALEISPNCVSLLRNHARRMVGRNDWLGALQTLYSIPSNERQPEDTIHQVLCLLRSGQPELALKEASAVLPYLAGEPISEVIGSLKLEAAYALGKFDHTLEELKALFPTSAAILSTAIGLLSKEDPRRNQLVSELSELVASINEPRDRFHAAEGLYEAGEFHRAAELLDGLHPLDVDHPALDKRIRALYFADQRLEARKLFESLSEKLKTTPKYANIGIAIYERSGLLKEARSAIEQLIKTSDELHTRLRWLEICLRLGDTETVISWLRTVSPTQDGRPADLMALSHALDGYLTDPKCFPVAYRALRAGYSDPRIQAAYAIGLFIMGKAKDALPTPPTTVAVDTAVTLKEKDGEKHFTRIIETEKAPQIEREEVAPDGDVARKLLGLKKGDEVEFQTVALLPIRYVVTDIQNKFLYAHFRSLRNLDGMFPEFKGFGSFKISEDKGEEGFKPIFDSVRRRGEYIRTLEDAYTSKSLPLAGLAKLASSTVFDVWEAYYQTPQMMFQVSLGTDAEYQLAAEAFRDNTRIVVDPVTLYGLVRIGIAGQIRSLTDDMAIVQTTRDSLRDLLRERSQKKGTEQHSMSWDGERYQMLELTEGMIAAQINDAKNALAFAESLTLLPSESERGIDDKAKPIFSQLDDAYLDSVLAAQQNGYVLLSDDIAFRVLASESANVDCVFTHALAYVAFARVDDATTFLSISNQLIEAGYGTTRMSYLNLLHEFAASNGKTTARIERLCMALARPENDRESVVAVLADVLRYGNGEVFNLEQLRELFSAIFQAFRLLQPDLDIHALSIEVFVRVKAIFQHNAARFLYPKHLNTSSSMVPVHVAATRARNACNDALRNMAEPLERAALTVSPLPIN